MKENNKQQFENILYKIKNNDILITKLITYLETNNLLDEFYLNTHYLIEKSEPIYKIKYYKDKSNNKLLNMVQIKNSHNLSMDNLEKYIVYVYDETKTLNFMGIEINKETVRRSEYSKTFDNLVITMHSLNLDHKFKEQGLFGLIKENPLLFVQIVAAFNINMDELDKTKEGSHVYKKEIKNN